MPAGTAIPAPTAATRPSVTTIVPFAMSGPDTGCTVAPVSAKLLAGHALDTFQASPGEAGCAALAADVADGGAGAAGAEAAAGVAEDAGVSADLIRSMSAARAAAAASR